MFRLGTKTSFILLLLLLTFVSSANIVVGHSARPRNLRLSIAGNQVVATWSHPAGVDSATYFVRRTIRYAGESWSGWSSSVSITGTSRALDRISTHDSFDIRVIVELFAHGSVHSAATASLCGVSSSSSGGSCGGGGESGNSARRRKEIKPVVHTCMTLSSASNGINVSSSAGLESGIQCQQLDGPGIGIASIIEAGYTHAVDVWGTFQDVQVCFENASGSMLFLDSANSPRTAASIESFVEEGKACANIDRPGSLVLVPAQGTVTAAPSERTATVPRSTFGCKVTTTTFLSFRESPNGPNVFFYVQPDVTLYATSRVDDWFRVRLLNTDGWISARYVTSEGVCG